MTTEQQIDLVKQAGARNMYTLLFDWPNYRAGILDKDNTCVESFEIELWEESEDFEDRCYKELDKWNNSIN